MRLYLVRHGETIENQARIVQGHLEGKLNQSGLKQAKLIARRLANHSFKHIYSSDLSRSFDTTTEIATYHQSIPLTTTPDLRERYFGYLQGKRRSDVHSEEVIQNNPPETDQSLRKRVSGFLQYLKKQHPIDQILVVAHSGTNRIIFEEIIGYTHPDSLKNTSLSIFEISNCANQLHLYNCTKHLQ